jgi:xanthine dehydrogenase accessory factor
MVWRRAPASGHVGSKAIIRTDGSVHGWISGACAEPTLLREALEAIGDGRPRLLFLGRPEELGGRADDGLVTVPMACDSEGAIEVYVEPVLPNPQVVVVGRSPVVRMLTRLALDLGWDVTVIDDGGTRDAHPHPERVRTTLDLDDLGINGASAVVVATQGHYDDLALEAALRTKAGYIGLVASAKRSASTLELLRSRGANDQDVTRINAPAGLDLGPVAHEEIAVAVLAGLVALRAAGQLNAAGGTLSPARTVAVDPVCGMTVDVEDSKYHSRFGGVDHWFCAAGCKAAFDADPHRFRAAP